jgi:hypothetical protein
MAVIKSESLFSGLNLLDTGASRKFPIRVGSCGGEKFQTLSAEQRWQKK